MWYVRMKVFTHVFSARNNTLVFSARNNTLFICETGSAIHVSVTMRRKGKPDHKVHTD